MPQPKIVERKLKRQQAKGLAWVAKNLIEIDPRLPAEEWVTVLVHELLHIACPYMDEDEVDRVSKTLGTSLWGIGMRRTIQ